MTWRLILEHSPSGTFDGDVTRYATSPEHTLETDGPAELGWVIYDTMDAHEGKPLSPHAGQLLTKEEK